MLKRIKKQVMKNKIDKVGYFFNRQIMVNYCLTAANIKPDAAGTITIDFQEYERLKDIEHQWVIETQNLFLNNELMEQDLQLMKSILGQGD